jgi:hypothetical protein
MGNTVENIKNAKRKNTPSITRYRNADKRFQALVERGVASNRPPTEIGRCDSGYDTYSYNFSKQQ